MRSGMLVGAAAVATFGACSLPSGEGSGAMPRDGGVEASAPIPGDAAPDSGAGKRCDADEPFSTKTLLSELASDKSEVTIRLSADELEGYISSSRSGQYQIYRVSRAKRSDPFGVPVLLPELDAPNALAVYPTVTSDGLLMLFDSDRSGQRQLWRSTRLSRAAPWGIPALLPGVETMTCRHPFFTWPEDEVWFSVEGGAGLDLWHGRRTKDGMGLVEVTPAQELNTNQDDASATLSVDGLSIYFASQRTGRLDIYRAKRSARNLPFDEPIAVDELNAEGRQLPAWLSADQCRLYYVASPSTMLGVEDLWLATRAP